MKTSEERAAYYREYYLKNIIRKKENSEKLYLANKEKICEARKEHYLNNKEEILKRDKEYYLKNKEVILNKKKKYALKNSDKLKQYRLDNVEKSTAYNIEYNLNNQEKISERKKEYYSKKSNSIIAYGMEYKKKRYSTDPTYKLAQNIRNLIRDSLRNGGYSKKSKTSLILGCSFDEFKAHLESLFEPWMNWDNRGNWNGIPKTMNIAWDIDHIIPLSSAKNEEELLKLNHYSNLQPLCSYINRYIKRDKLL